MEQYARKTQTAEPLVYYTVVFSVVTQYSSWKETLRQDTKNGCVADYGAADKREISVRGRRKMGNGKEKKAKGKRKRYLFLSLEPPPFSPPSLTRSMPARQATLELGLQPWVSRFARDPLHSWEINGGRAKSQLEWIAASSIPSRAGNSHARTNHHWLPREKTSEEQAPKISHW